MALTLVTAPAREPVTLQQAKDHIRVTGSDDDADIGQFINTAITRIEDLTHRALITRTYDLFLDCFESKILLPNPPAQTITTVKYLDTDGVQQTLAASVYKLDVNSHPARLVEAFEQIYPTVRLEINSVEIRYITGYGDNAEDVPEPLIQAILLMVGHFYNNREDTIPAVSLAHIPDGVRQLIAPYVDKRF